MYLNLNVSDVQGSESNSKWLFTVMVRGILNCSVNLLATFLNVSTIVVICKYKNLKTTSNALIIGFSIGNSLSGINGILTLITTFGPNKLSHTWTVICSMLGFFLLWQQFINIFSLMSISLERAYSVYFPLHSLKTNSFNKMTKVSTFIIIFTLLKSASEVWLGFEFGNNFRRRHLCLIRTLVGSGYSYYTVIGVFVICSTISLTMTLAIICKVIHVHRRRSTITTTRSTNMEYKVIKMSIMGRFLSCFFYSASVEKIKWLIFAMWAYRGDTLNTFLLCISQRQRNMLNPITVVLRTYL